MTDSLRLILRKLHRDIGFFLIGMTILYVFSGAILIFRDSGFLLEDRRINENIGKGLSVSDIKAKLHGRIVGIISDTDEVLLFKDGRYDRLSGEISFLRKTYPYFVEKLTAFHKLGSRNFKAYFSFVYSILLLFLALSSLLMSPTTSSQFKRGAVLSFLGIMITLTILLI